MKKSDTGFSFRRLYAFCRKESLQISRDPTTILVAFILPVIMLFIYGYGLNLDTGRTRIGLYSEDFSPEAREFAANLTGSPYFLVTSFDSLPAAEEALARSHIHGFAVLPADFSQKLKRSESAPGAPAPIQIITDGSEPNTANFVQGYVSGAWQNWLLNRAESRGAKPPPAISVETRFWYNPSAESRFYLVPGSITIIMTVVGALLTALVVAREWERGTMEALLASPISRTEFLLGKVIPYYALGVVILFLCVGVSHFAMGIPFRGSMFMLWACGSLFLLSVFGMGLTISTATKNQFNAAQIALITAFLPALLLSGFIFEIASMPPAIRAISMVIPARYFATAIQTLSQVGDVWPILEKSILFLTGTAILFFGLAAKLTKRRLD